MRMEERTNLSTESIGTEKGILSLRHPTSKHLDTNVTQLYRRFPHRTELGIVERWNAQITKKQSTDNYPTEPRLT